MEKRLVNDVLFMERTTHRVYSDDFRILFLSLKMVPEEWHNCKTELERLLYLVKNMENLDKNSEPYKTREYSDMFDTAELASFAAEDVVAYSNSYLKELDNQSAIRFAARENRKEGIQEGIQETLRKVVTNMRAKGYDDQEISDLIGESLADIKEIFRE